MSQSITLEMHMPGRSIRVHLLIALSLLFSDPAELPAKEEVILVYPGVMKTIPGPKKPKAAKRRNPRVGTRKTESRLAGVSIERATAKSARKGARKSARKKSDEESTDSKLDEENESRSDEIETIEAEKRENTIQIMAEDGAAGQLFTLSVLFTVRTSQYKRFSRDEFGKKIQPYTSWVDLPDRERKQDYTLAVALGTVPQALVPNGKEMTITLPEALRQVVIKRARRSQAEVKLQAGNRLRILGKKPGDTEFEFRYELAGKKLTAKLPVRVLDKENIVSLTVAEDRREEIGIDELDELFDLHDGRIVRISPIEDPSVAQIAFDAFRVQVKGLKPGKTRAMLHYTGAASGKGRKRLRCQAQVPVLITVK